MAYIKRVSVPTLDKSIEGMYTYNTVLSHILISEPFRLQINPYAFLLF